MRRATAVGPRPQRVDPSRSFVWVGNWAMGPTPQKNSPGLAGERNAEKKVSPRPNWVFCPGPKGGWEMTGNMVRVIRFQFVPRRIGITG